MSAPGHVARRRFDHDEARRLYADGMTGAELARRYGVTAEAVYLVVNPAYRARRNDYKREYQRGKLRRPCLGGCGTLAWRRPGRSGYCPACSGLLRAKGVRPDGLLLCHRCDEWKPDDAFPRKKAAKARRGRSSLCRGCETAARQEYRERHKIPCVECGQPCLPPGERGQRESFTGLCRSCYERSPLFMASREKAVRASAVARRLA